MPSVTIKAGRVQPIWAGHPWVYAQAIEAQQGQLAPGCEVDVIDSKGNLLGRGLWSPNSAIAVRLFTRKNLPIDANLIRSRLESAQQLRRDLDLPNNETTAYRLVHGEGDGLPGLVVDVLGRQLSVQLGTIGLWQRRDEVFALLRNLLHPDVIHDRTPERLAKLEGFSLNASADETKPQGFLRFAELGVRYTIPHDLQQKTGYYCDQRPLREWLRARSDGRRLLDTFSYVGSLGLCAARGGAKHVDCVERSGPAVATSKQLAIDNNLTQVEVHQADVSEFMREVPNHTYDLTICDPPKLATNKKGVDNALRKLRALVSDACRVTVSGGEVVLCSCSAAIKHAELSRALAFGAQDAGCQVTITHRFSQGPDHPVAAGFTEGEYLSTLVGRVMKQ
jgi:23S rRNA (cytosine1962-C5)-methyltransferase